MPSSAHASVPPASSTHPEPLRKQVDRGDAAVAAARALTKDWDGVDVQQLPPVANPIAAPNGVALSLRTFHWLRDRECLLPRRSGAGSGSEGDGDTWHVRRGGRGGGEWDDATRHVHATRRHDSRARRHGLLTPNEAPCIATALFHDWGGLGYFSTVAGRRGTLTPPDPQLKGTWYPGGFQTLTLEHQSWFQNVPFKCNPRRYTVAKKQGVAFTKTSLVVLMSGPRHWWGCTAVEFS
jgi:hypothetical protein